MAGLALTTIGVKFGYGVGTLTEPPKKWEQIEECVNIGAVDTKTDKIDVTPLEASNKKYAEGYADTGGELLTTFNLSDEFEKQWDKMLAADKAKTSGQVMWYCAFHPDRAKMDVYQVQPGKLPKPEYAPGSPMQVKISNTLVDIPDPIAKSEPTVTPEAP